jgi:hypothetical protein
MRHALFSATSAGRLQVEFLDNKVQIERRLDVVEELGRDVASHVVEISVLKTNMEKLTRRLSGLTKGICGFMKPKN